MSKSLQGQTMLTPAELDDFFGRQSVRTIEVRYDGCDAIVSIQRDSYGNIVGIIPRSNPSVTNVFSIESALKSPECGAEYTESEEGFRVRIVKRHQIRTVINIALLYLDWMDEGRIHATVLPQSMSSNS